jgi:phosphate:Na+ symporter
MKEMQGNVDRYMCADNDYVRREYNTIRLDLAILLRSLFKSDAEVGPVRKLEQLKAFRLRMEEEDIIANGTLDKLIRENLITPDMATSLMNDSAYAYDIQNNLIDAAEIIFAHVFSLEKDLSLMEEETDKAFLGKRSEFLSRLREEEARIDAITGHQPREDSSDSSPTTS